MADIAERPIDPVYPFNEPGQPIPLYQGPIGGLSESGHTGTVDFNCSPKPGIAWKLNSRETFYSHVSEEVTLLLHRENGDMKLPAWVRGGSDGWSNGGEFGEPDARISRVLAHWFNLPNWIGPVALSMVKGDGYQHVWRGRWTFNIADWRITFDARPDHSKIWRELHESRVFVMTHVMEMKRTDGTSFSPAEAKKVLSALHMGLSFALGRFVAPMLPVGLDIDGARVWESWRASFCDPARSINAGWWYYQDLDSLQNLLAHTVRAFNKSADYLPLRLQLEFAISAIKDEGFVEQRITIGTAGLEHLTWQELVLSGRMSKNQYEGRTPFEGKLLKAHDRLRILLKDAQVSLSVDQDLLPAGARYLAENQGGDESLDGVDLVTRVRNKITHPQGNQDAIYRVPKLVTDVWLMTCHYLSYLILHSLGFSGSARNMMKRTGWAGEVEIVPWNQISSETHP